MAMTAVMKPNGGLSPVDVCCQDAIFKACIALVNPAMPRNRYDAPSSDGPECC
jgi:hypothetical protein